MADETERFVETGEGLEISQPRKPKAEDEDEE